MPQSKVVQLALSPEARVRLTNRVRMDYESDSADLERRTNAMRRWYRLWRNAQELAAFPDQEKSSFSIPLVLWNILAKLSRELDALLGDESEIVVKPIGDTDIKRIPKVRKWMNWRVKQSLKLFQKLYVHLLQKWVFGTSIAFIPWVTRKRLVKEQVPVTQIVTTEQVDPTTGLATLVPQEVVTMEEREREIVEFDGPDFIVENLEDWIIPKGSESLDEADHFIRRLRLRFDEVLDLRDQGKLDDKVLNKELLARLRRLAETGKVDASETASGNEVTQEKELAAGENPAPQGREELIRVYNWFGKFRVKESDERAQDVVAFFQPDTNLLLGAARLVDIFPDGRRPFVVSRGILDINQFWGIGLCEQLENISIELDGLYNLANQAGEGAIGPVVFYSPTGGVNMDNLRIEPYMAIPTADPNSVKAVNLGQIQLQPYVILTQQLMAMAERLTALTDQQLGRQFDRPNAPRTFGQQQLLQEQSNVRLLLDIRLERESLRDLLHRIWELDKRFLEKPFFFRVTEEDPGDVLTVEDMQGEYDFDIGPVTALSNRFQALNEIMQALAITTPLGVPPVTMALVRKLLDKLGQHDVAQLVPSIEDMQPPQRPEDENARLLQGEDVQPSPLDNHVQHIAIHTDLINRIQGTAVEAAFPGIVGKIQAHIDAHAQLAKQTPALAGIAPGGNGARPSQPSVPPTGAQSPLGNIFGQGGNPAQADLNSILNQGRLNLG